MTPLVEARNVTKRFGLVVANDGISLALQAGEIHAVLGENGAGKTTLLNLLAGVYQPDAGQILIDGRPVVLNAPGDALRLGIGTVYQHFTLVPNLTVLENVVMGANGGFRLDLGSAERRVKNLLKEFGLGVPLSDPSVSRDDKLSPHTEIRYLALGQRQRVEIVKALYRDARVLLLDEPTSVLTPVEVDGLFAILRRLRDTGVAVALITHKLEEALAVSDRLTVLSGVSSAIPATGRDGDDERSARFLPLSSNETRSDQFNWVGWMCNGKWQEI